MKRKSKSYLRPKKAFEKERILEENALKKKYALKNKKEVWKAQAKIDYFRRRAKDLASSSQEEQELFFNKLKYLGLKVSSIVEVLALKVEDILERRLPTILVKKKLANTTKHARQLVVHKKILVNGSVVNSPSYLVPVSEESQVSLKKKEKKKPVKEEAPAEEPKEEASEEKVEESQEAPKEEAQDGGN